MTEWTAARVTGILGTGRVPERTFRSISTDTRQLGADALFVALTGERFDGHAFLTAARDAGATGAVVRRGTPPVAGLGLFEVDDPLDALGRLARDRRAEIGGPVVAITGTNGKTSTRVMIARTLGVRWQVHATRENLNNLIGVPLTILGAPPEAEALVIECGANLPGEIARLRSIVEPSIGVVTNVGAGHLAGFGTIEGVLREKLQLLAGVPLAVVGTDPPALATRARTVAARVVSAGLEPPADIVPDSWSLDDEAHAVIRFRSRTIRLPVSGAHQAANAVLALAVATELELDLDLVAAGLGQVELPHGRCEVLRGGNLTLLYDAYNANPASLSAALATAGAMRRDRRLVVALGSMLELGPESDALHRRMADATMALAPDLIAVVGEFERAFAPHRSVLGERLLVAPDTDALGRAIKARLRGDELVLLKGSRGVRMERALPHLIPGLEVPCSTTS